MKRSINATLAAALLASGSAFAVGQSDLTGSQAVIGSPVDRTIVVRPNTRWINVNQGETVNFVLPGTQGAETIAWRFDGQANRLMLGDIHASAGNANNVPIYVNQTYNPLSQGDSE
jgi:hypothetical protein